MKQKKTKLMTGILAAAIILQGIIPNTQAAPVKEENTEEEYAAEGYTTEEYTTKEYTAEEDAAEGYTPEEYMAEEYTPETAGAEGSGEDLSQAEIATAASAIRMEKPDLWDRWTGKTDFPGDGTKDCPYRITSLAYLMGLSQAVAQGETFEGVYFELTASLDLSPVIQSVGRWNPIGWYRTSGEIGGRVEHPFSGIFDGRGNTIRGLSIVESDEYLDEIGLFGVIDGGTVENLTVFAGNVAGSGNAAVLAGSVYGDSVIRNVTVSGSVLSREGNAGGITAEADGMGGRATLENCRADGISVSSDAGDKGAGGIAGTAADADLVDVSVRTWDNTGRIRGAGSVGGVVGVSENCSLYNSYVEGTVGGSRSRASGGIIGTYKGGEMILARFAGTIGSSGLGLEAREGTFVGDRDDSAFFCCGTDPGDHFAYLFTDSAEKAGRAVGSGIDGDNTFTASAHIGYWLDHQRTYRLIGGNTSVENGDRFFYEELEDGVRHIITTKLLNDFTWDGASAGKEYRLDHFAPGSQGQPVRGYLLSVPRIDTRNANGTYDTDVAALTAMPEGGQSYYRAIDKNHPAAVVPGTVVSVITAPNNTESDRYEMAEDPAAAGGVKAPTYINALGREVPMSYVSGGIYSFVMPARDTQINAEYVKATTALSASPDEMRLSVTQIRTGDRKAPRIVTEVNDANGALIARYIDGAQDEQVRVQPVRIHCVHNLQESTADRSVLWSVDDADLLHLVSDAGYTEDDARIFLNPDSSFIREIVEEQEKIQADGGYLEAIRPVIYERRAVVTASSNPKTSADHVAVHGNCRVTVTFRILDETTLRVEGLDLNRSDVTVTITRRLTGNRSEPQQTITVSAPVVLEAILFPDEPFNKNVSWHESSGGTAVLMSAGGENNSQCTVTARYDAEGIDNPAWIQNVINEDDQRKKEDPNVQLSGSAVRTETITATAEDRTHGAVSAKCRVTLQFRTLDETRPRGSYSGSGGTVSIGDSAVPTAAADTVLNALQGKWVCDAQGRWTFSSEGRIVCGSWAYIVNPYADPEKGQASADWFYFDDDGYMAVGWRWIKGQDGRMKCYYFNEHSDGCKGAMLHDTVTPDGYQVNESGAWIEAGTEQTR